MAMGKAVCFHDEPWQHCNLFLMCFGGNRPHRTVLSPSQFTPVLKVTELCMFWALWCIYTLILIRQGAWILSIHWLVAPCLKEISYPRQPFILFHVTLSFRRRHPVVDFNFCSVDMEHRQIRGHHWVRRYQLIHHISSKKNPHRHFPPGLAHYRDTTSSQSITETTDNDDLIYTLWPHSFFHALTSSIYSLIVLSAQETYHVTSLLQTGLSVCLSGKWNETVLVFFLPDAHRHGDACYFLTVCQCINCFCVAAVKKLQENLWNMLISCLAKRFTSLTVNMKLPPVAG